LPTIAIMVNLMTMPYGAVADQFVRWVRSIIAVANIGTISVVMLIKRAGLVLFSADALPLMRQQLFDSTVELRRQSGQHILEVGKWVMPAELGRLQQAHHHGSTLAGQFTADEQPILAIMHIYS
jgi:hypothetical protein